jgi:biopolymer transport protein ExbB
MVEQNPYGMAAMWAQGDWVTRSVALLLLVMSVASWTVIILKSLRLIQLKRDAAQADQFWHTHSFAEGLKVLGSDGSNPFHHMAIEGQAAVNHHATAKDDLHGQMNLADWLSEALRGARDDAAEKLQSGLSVLASVGSTAPFVGLFGTVWGIYHALVGIGVSGQASIDKVAGPVGEALIMTAFGLAVAIPAVLGYNALTRSNKSVLGKLNRFSRQLHAYFLTGSPLKKDSAVRAVSMQRGGN